MMALFRMCGAGDMRAAFLPARILAMGDTDEAAPPSGAMNRVLEQLTSSVASRVGFMKALQE
ncbi:hypothetical protein [Shinella zoogloeoides]|uniref:hypothetical protein n=1 Tax=Shinella zoogloeoides TaxID=352475 RepID=UPI00299D08A2|nr:hypothetical protein [Shinella zoogloeoides]